MVDFVHVARTEKWLQRPGPQTVQPLDERKVVYLNEMSKLGDKPYEHVVAAGVESAAPEAKSERAVQIKREENGGNAASALMWPKTAYQEQRAFPFVSAGIGALVVAPLIMPDVALTGYLLAGYSFGVVSQWVAQQQLTPQQPTQPIEKFIVAKAASEKITLQSPSLDIAEQPTASLQQQISGLQGAF